MSPDAPQFFHRSNDDRTLDSICLHCFRTAATQNREADLAIAEQVHVCTPKLFFVPPGHKVYRVDLCDAIKSHVRCPGFTLLSAGGFELGPFACICPCHKKPSTEN